MVVRDEGALGLLLGNFGASTVVLLGLWVRCATVARRRAAREQLRPMLRFGLPTVPAEVSVFALNLVDRLYLFRVESEAAAGLYSLRSSSPASSIFTVRAFQYAWPPLAYSIGDDAEAGRVYARITTYYVLFTGSWSPGSRCSAAGSSGSSPRPRSSRRTRRCHGSGSAGRSTGCSWCSSRWRAARR